MIDEGLGKKVFWLKDIIWHVKWVFYDLKKGLLNRFGLYNSYRDYWQRRKKGGCVMCGNCCCDIKKGLMTGFCEHFDFITKKCKVYGKKYYNDRTCNLFPLDPHVAKLDSCQGYAFGKGSFFHWLIGGK